MSCMECCDSARSMHAARLAINGNSHMCSERTAIDYSEAVLRAVCAIGSNTWCLLPIGTDTISHCSTGFRRLWNLSCSEELPIPISSPHLEDAFRHHGYSASWMRSFTQIENGGLPDSPAAPDFSEHGVVVKFNNVTDATAQPSGRIIIFEHATSHPVPTELRRRTQAVKEQLAKLTEPETQILDLVYAGFTNKAIGIRSQISEKTVEKHRSNIMQKLGIRNAVTLVCRVTEAKLFSDLVDNRLND